MLPGIVDQMQIDPLAWGTTLKSQTWSLLQHQGGLQIRHEGNSCPPPPQRDQCAHALSSVLF